MTSIKMKRVYEEPSSSDGFRVLVDRLWPRGVKKEAAHIDLWLKNIAPSPELRKWFCHDPELFDTFKIRYMEELETDPVKKEAMDVVRKELKTNDVTFVYAAKDPIHNHVRVLKEFME